MFTLIARLVFFPPVTIRGNGEVVIMGVAGGPVIVVTLPASHPIIP
jgi:hypothetical protein